MPNTTPKTSKPTTKTPRPRGKTKRRLDAGRIMHRLYCSLIKQVDNLTNDEFLAVITAGRWATEITQGGGGAKHQLEWVSPVEFVKLIVFLASVSMESRVTFNIFEHTEDARARRAEHNVEEAKEAKAS